MIRILVISILLFLSYQNINAQEIKKEKVFLLFEKNKGNLPYYRMKKFKNKKGINFNLKKYAFLHKKDMKKDTLSICLLNNFNITNEFELKNLEKQWRKKNEKALKKKYILYKQIDRNGVFDVNIIEKINDKQIVIYQVIFRNEGVIP